MAALTKDLEDILESAIARARQAARPEASIDHLLLALLDDPAASNMLKSLGVATEALLADMEKRCSQETASDDVSGADREPKLSRDVERALRRAIIEGQAAREDQISVTRLLKSGVMHQTVLLDRHVTGQIQAQEIEERPDTSPKGASPDWTPPTRGNLNDILDDLNAALEAEDYTAAIGLADLAWARLDSELLRHRRDLEPERVDVLLGKGEAHMRLSQHSAARNAYFDLLRVLDGEVLEGYPDYDAERALSHTNIGLSFIMSKDWQRAEFAFSVAHTIYFGDSLKNNEEFDSDRAWLLMQRSIARAMIGDRDSASRDLEEAERLCRLECLRSDKDADVVLETLEDARRALQESRSSRADQFVVIAVVSVLYLASVGLLFFGLMLMGASAVQAATILTLNIGMGLSLFFHLTQGSVFSFDLRPLKLTKPIVNLQVLDRNILRVSDEGDPHKIAERFCSSMFHVLRLALVLATILILTIAITRGWPETSGGMSFFLFGLLFTPFIAAYIRWRFFVRDETGKLRGMNVFYKMLISGFMRAGIGQNREDTPGPKRAALLLVREMLVTFFHLFLLLAALSGFAALLSAVGY